MRIVVYLFFLFLSLTLSKLIIVSPSLLVELIFFIILIISILKTTIIIIPMMNCACGVTSTIIQSTNESLKCAEAINKKPYERGAVIL